MPDNTKSSFINELFKQLYNSSASTNYVIDKAVNAAGEDSTLYKSYHDVLKEYQGADFTDRATRDEYHAKLGDVFKTQIEDQNKFFQNPLGGKDTLGTLANGQKGTALKNTMQLLGANIAAHPYKTAGIGALGIANVAGLMDNDKVGGQIVGGLGGAALPMLLSKAGLAMPGALGKAAMVMGGGALGSLFDKLRAKKEAEQQAMYQQQPY